MMNKHVEVFMPGRLCILGEHSDWAACHREKNQNIEKGYAIVAGLDLGIYLKGWQSNGFIYEYNDKKISLSCDDLLNYNLKDFFEYAVASARIMHMKYPVDGAKVICEKMTLPIKKGLASSAAICVAIIRLYNLLYELGLSVEEEMSLAYEAELSTGSECGRMDQICAYGQGLRKICFDGNRVEVSELKQKKELCFILVDLHSNKYTKKILADLSSAYAFMQNERENKFINALGCLNKESVINAEINIANGNLIGLGDELMRFQNRFDESVACFSSELKAPLLHELIENAYKIEGVLACKGVGSQGDGMAQILVESEDMSKSVIKRIQDSFFYDCYTLKVG